MSEPSGKERKFWKWPKSKWLLGIPIGGFVMMGVGAAGLLGMNYALHATSTSEFCLSCHTHKGISEQEFASAGHSFNGTGIRAECADCHLPNPEEKWFSYVKMKMIVSLDIFAELRGVANTPEKYEAKRGEWAKHVWTEYRKNDSEFCRHCHEFDHMTIEQQPRLAQRRHKHAMENGQTCIDCHQGIAHALPENWEEIWDEVVEKTSKTASTETGTRLASGD
jgi:nitrate/TMAO reductase-like tetraheme cytochrome c subunit